MKDERDLAGRTILITGANTGIGRATAVALGARGARLYLAGRSADRMQPVLDEIRSGGNEAVSFCRSISVISRRCARARRASSRRAIRCTS
jgi:NAD(P)-dependent dehydrogenase (short-subunit alcohol dehydrogenase family)